MREDIRRQLFSSLILMLEIICLPSIVSLITILEDTRKILFFVHGTLNKKITLPILDLCFAPPRTPQMNAYSQLMLNQGETNEFHILT